MIVKFFELEKTNLKENNLLLLYGSNEGLKEDAISERNLDLINVTLAEILKESTGLDKEKGVVTGEIDADLISKLTDRKPVTNIAEDSGMASTPKFSFTKDTNIDKKV